MRIEVKDGKAIVVLMKAEQRVLRQAHEISKALSEHGGGNVTAEATETQLGIEKLLTKLGTEW